MPWVAEGNLTACPRGTLRPECRRPRSVIHTHTSTLFHTLPAGTTLQHFYASFTLKLSRCVLLLTCSGCGCALLLVVSLLDHRIVFTRGIPALWVSTVARLAQGARTGFSSKDWASCWSDGLTHRAWYSWSPSLPVLSLRSTRMHPGTFLGTSHPPGTGSLEAVCTLPSSAWPANSPLTLTLLLRCLGFILGLATWQGFSLCIVIF